MMNMTRYEPGWRTLLPDVGTRFVSIGYHVEVAIEDGLDNGYRGIGSRAGKVITSSVSCKIAIDVS